MSSSPSPFVDDGQPTPHDEGHEPIPSNASDDSACSSAATNHVLQIVFDPQVQSNRRRKSSLVDMDAQRLATSSCFVHALLETQRKRNHQQPMDVEQARAMKERQAHEERLTDCGTYAAMTKTQLSDMVLGVRELSKHLGTYSEGVCVCVDR